MKIAVTGATGFLGRYIVRQLVSDGHTLRAWFRPDSDRSGFDGLPGAQLEWIEGTLNDVDASRKLVAGCDAVVHGALHHPGGGFRGGEGDLVEFVERNVVGTIALIEAARSAGAGRFVFISTCAVHEIILDDRPLDEAHPLWATSHYGAHKAAIEKFVHSYGLGDGYAICALRPTGIYGLAHPARDSKWFKLVRAVQRGESVEVSGGGKEVHAADVAKATAILLAAPADKIRGQAFNCYDRYISQHEVATIARDLAGSDAKVVGEPKQPKNQIETGKLRGLGMQFGGEVLLRTTIGQLLTAAEHA